MDQDFAPAKLDPIKFREIRMNTKEHDPSMLKEWKSTDAMTIPGLFAARLEWEPERIFIEIDGQQRSFAAFDHDANRLAHGLRDLGVGQSDTVCALFDNSLDALLVMFALGKLGAIYVPLNSGLRGEFLRHQINDSCAALLLADARYAPRILDLGADLPEARILLVRGFTAPPTPGPLRIAPFDMLWSNRGEPIATAVKPTDLALIIYTSGTTGPSKGCMVSHNYVCNYARQMAGALGLQRDDIYWSALPLFHMGGIGTVVLAGLHAGCKVVLATRFSVSNYWPEIEKSRATVTTAVGSMIALVAEAPDNAAMSRCFGQLRVVCGAPFPETLREKWRSRFGVAVVNAPGYGLTEASMVTLHSLHLPAPPGASGRRFEDFDVRIIDPNGDECPPGMAGEIIVRPLKPNVMFGGYWKRPAETLATMRDLWFNTGDIGRFDAQGFFYFVDRKKDYLRRRGENVSSFEVETTFRLHADIADAAVHAVPSQFSEDDIKATIVLKETAALTEEELCRWSIDVLPSFAVPRYIEFRKDLPRNPTGRVLKYQLRAEGVTAATWDRELCPSIVVKSSRRAQGA